MLVYHPLHCYNLIVRNRNKASYIKNVENNMYIIFHTKTRHGTIFLHTIIGSGALSGLMLDLGLLKISLGRVFAISSFCGGV